MPFMRSPREMGTRRASACSSRKWRSSTSRRRPMARSTPACISSTTSKRTRRDSRNTVIDQTRGPCRGLSFPVTAPARRVVGGAQSLLRGWARLTNRGMDVTQQDMFLKVEGAKAGAINGESQDGKHKDEIEIVSWSWGMESRTDMYTGQAYRRATIKELTVLKHVDKASTALMSALTTNEPIKSAILTVRKAGKNPLEYLKI